MEQCAVGGYLRATVHTVLGVLASHGAYLRATVHPVLVAGVVAWSAVVQWRATCVPGQHVCHVTIGLPWARAVHGTRIWSHCIRWCHGW